MNKLIVLLLLLTGCPSEEDPHSECRIDWEPACVQFPELRSREECARFEELWADMAKPSLPNVAR